MFAKLGPRLDELDLYTLQYEGFQEENAFT